MILTLRQLKAKVRNMSKGDSLKAQTIMRHYAMERFLERLSLSGYRNNLILKGGVLVSAIIGIDNRSTMDIDTTVKNFTLTEKSAREAVAEIANIIIADGMSFKITNVEPIMDEADYPGVRVKLETFLETMSISFKIDFSAGDVITPQEVSYAFKLLFEERSIPILAYNIETVLAEKIETIIARGPANSRMRDFYDIYAIESTHTQSIDYSLLKSALANTSKKRGSSHILDDRDMILNEIEGSPEMLVLWENYQRKFDYASEITWNEAMQSIRRFVTYCF